MHGNSEYDRLPITFTLQPGDTHDDILIELIKLFEKVDKADRGHATQDSDKEK